MNLELETVFNNPGELVRFDYPLKGFDDLLPLAALPQVTGLVKNRAGIVTLEGTASVRLKAQCDRCASPLEYSAQVPLEHTLVLQRNCEDDGELILLDGYRFSPDALVWEDIVLSMPQKMLCKADCKGLCPQCGANLNESMCGCKPAGDPRLAALRELIIEE